MNIGQASAASGISAKMIRYYESIGLVPRVGRTDGGYRDYETADVHRLRFIKRARDLGFSFEQVRELLKLWSDRRRSSSSVKKVALVHIEELEARRRELDTMIGTLRSLATACGGDDRPDCPIIEDLEAGGACAHTSKAGKKVRARAGA